MEIQSCLMRLFLYDELYLHYAFIGQLDLTYP